MSDSVSLQTLEEMKRFYQAEASEYDESFNRQGRYDQGSEWIRGLEEQHI